MNADPRDFGKALRQRVEDTAGAVAKTQVDAGLQMFGDDIRARVATITKAQAKAEVAELKADLQAESRYQARVLEQVEKRLGEIAGQLGLIDVEKITVMQAELDADARRMIKQRGALAEDLVEIRKAESQLRLVAKALVEQTEQVDHVAVTIGAQLVEMRKDSEDRARAAAMLAVADMESVVLRKMQLDHDTMRKETEASMTALRTEIREALASVIEKFSADAAELQTQLVKAADAATDPSGPDMPLVPRSFRGPYVEGEVYKRGDMVMFLGSTWIAKRQTPARPAISDSPASPWGLFAAGGFGHKLTDKQKRQASVQAKE